MFANMYIRNNSLNRVVKRILRQIHYYSDKCQQIEQIYIRKLNALNPQPMYLPLLDYLPIHIMFLNDQDLVAIVERMDEVNENLLAQFEKLIGCEGVFDKKITPLEGVVKTINSEMVKLTKLINTDLHENLDAVRNDLDLLDKKTTNIHMTMIGKDVQDNIYLAAAGSLDQAVRILEEFIIELNGLLYK